MKTLKHLVSLCALAGAPSLCAQAEDLRPAKGVQDNSFFIEEAYNQEPGVVQHIFNATYGVNRRRGPDDKEWTPVFTQEWPLGTQRHQFSFTAPYSFMESGGEFDNGIGDILINYRLQAFTETPSRPAFAPRLSLVLPTGDEDRGFGDGSLGFQINLPVSKIVSDRWTLHANAGLTFLPDVQDLDLVHFNLGGSAIYAVNRRLNLMLECVGNFDDEPDDTGGRRRSSSVILSPGVRYAFNFKNDAQVVVGLAAPMGLTSDAPDYGAVIYFSIEHFFAR